MYILSVTYKQFISKRGGVFLSLKQDGLFLHEPCEVSQQCTGTTNAQNCNKYKNGTQALCTCTDGYFELYAKCYKSKR